MFIKVAYDSEDLIRLISIVFIATRVYVDKLSKDFPNHILSSFAFVLSFLFFLLEKIYYVFKE